MSKFDAMRASGEMMPTAMGTAAMDGKNSSSKHKIYYEFSWA